MDIGLVRKAMAFRVKYRVSDKKRTVPLSRLGVHPQNRGGMYPQPDTVRNLGLKKLTKGFNQSEANHEGVSVEESHKLVMAAVAEMGPGQSLGHNYIKWWVNGCSCGGQLLVAVAACLDSRFCGIG